MANKEFQVRHGLVVGNNVLVANVTSNTVAVLGTITANNIQVDGSTIPSGAVSNLVYTTANSAFDVANSAYTVANNTPGAYNTANSAFDKANSANVLAYNTGIGANAYTDSVSASSNNYSGVMANSVNSHTSLTYVKLTDSSQTITGDLTITGNIVFGGNATSITSNNLIVNDSLIYLANNNPADILDIGFIGSYINATSANAHTGLFRDHASKQYYLFQGYDADPERTNDIVPYSNNMVNSVLVADFNTSNLTLGGANAIVWIASAFGVANATYGQVNTLATSANAYAQTVGTSGNNYAGVMANSVNAYTSATYSTLTQFGSVFGVANGAFGAANSKVASVTGTAGQIFSSGGNAPTLNLISSGVTATTYGGATQIPVYTVDAFGRITSSANVAFSGGSGTVTSITAGTGLSGGTITSTGTISMPNVGPGAGSYSSGISALTLDAQGRVTAITGSAGYLTGITSGQVTTALGFTPYNATNPSGYITSSALTPYAALSGATFSGDVRSYRSASSTTGVYYFSQSGDYYIYWDGSNFNINGGYTTATGSMRSPLFYDSNDTAYYIDPNSTSDTALRMRGGAYFGPNTSWGRYLYVGGNGRPADEACVAATDGNLHIDSRSANSLYLNHYVGSIIYACNGGGYMQVAGSTRSPIFYDSNDTGYYCDPNSTSKFNNLNLMGGIASPTLAADYASSALEVREYNFGGAQTDSWSYAPRIGFHWGGRVASQIVMGSNGWLQILNNPGNANENFQAANIYATGNVTAYYSDERLKEILGPILNPIDILKSIRTFKYKNNNIAKENGFIDDDVQIGVSAQSVEKVLPEVVKHAPFDYKIVDKNIESKSGEWYKTVQYEKLIPVLIEAIKELQDQIDDLKTK